MKKTKRPKACGNTDCSISTGICGNLTFGCGDLDHNGYWEFPCEPCEERYLEEHGTLFVDSDGT